MANSKVTTATATATAQGISLHIGLNSVSGTAYSGWTGPLDHAATDKPDFWSAVGQTELGLLEALAQGRLAGAAPGLLHAFRELRQF